MKPLNRLLLSLPTSLKIFKVTSHCDFGSIVSIYAAESAEDLADVVSKDDLIDELEEGIGGGALDGIPLAELEDPYLHRYTEYN